MFENATKQIMALTFAILFLSSSTLASNIAMHPRQDITSVSSAPPTEPSSFSNLPILESPNYLTAMNETTANYTTVMVRDYYDQDLVYPLTYTLTSRNEVLAGDIVWGTEALLRELTVHSGKAKSKRTQPGTFTKRFFSQVPWAWPYATVIYRYDTCETKAQLSPIMDPAFAEWKSLAPYLNFVELAPSNIVSKGVLMITKDEPSNTWCWSNAGFWNGGTALRMNMQLYTLPDPVTGERKKTCGFNHATAMHELAHQLGMMHEQQRPDAAAHVKFHCENYFDPDCPTQKCCRDASGNFPPKDDGSGQCCSGVWSFEPLPASSIDVLGQPYDARSIVEYPWWASNNGKPTLTLVSDGSPVQDNMGIVSKGDLETLCEFYKEYCEAWKAADKTGSGCADSKCAVAGKVDTPGTTSCGTCDPIAGRNKCHPSASCVNTGGAHHCMCAAGFKAKGAANTDVSKHFRLPWANFEQIVFVAEGVECEQLCDFPHGISPQLCAEVPLQASCPL